MGYIPTKLLKAATAKAKAATPVAPAGPAKGPALAANRAAVAATPVANPGKARFMQKVQALAASKMSAKPKAGALGKAAVVRQKLK